MNPRAPRQIQAPDAAPSADGRRHLYGELLRASERQHEPQGFVALVLLELIPAAASMTNDERALGTATTRVAEVLNRRLRSVDLLVRSGSCELAVLLTLAHIGVAVAFSERMRQPIEQALRELGVVDEVAACMGLAANPAARPWHPDALIELAHFRMRAAMARALQPGERDWALFVESAALPPDWPDPLAWRATTRL